MSDAIGTTCDSVLEILDEHALWPDDWLYRSFPWISDRNAMVRTRVRDDDALGSAFPTGFNHSTFTAWAARAHDVVTTGVVPHVQRDDDEVVTCPAMILGSSDQGMLIAYQYVRIIQAIWGRDLRWGITLIEATAPGMAAYAWTPVGDLVGMVMGLRAAGSDAGQLSIGQVAALLDAAAAIAAITDAHPNDGAPR